MTGAIARKEFTEMWREGRMRWSAVIVFALLAGALALGFQNYRETNRARQEARLRRLYRRETMFRFVNQP
jgi:hypothetical protein